MKDFSSSEEDAGDVDDNGAPAQEVRESSELQPPQRSLIEDRASDGTCNVDLSSLLGKQCCVTIKGQLLSSPPTNDELPSTSSHAEVYELTESDIQRRFEVHRR